MFGWLVGATYYTSEKGENGRNPKASDNTANEEEKGNGIQVEVIGSLKYKSSHYGFYAAFLLKV